MSLSLQTDPTGLPLLNKYLSQIDVYFEYGCGTSTYLASNVDNIKKIYSVESDIEWANCIKQKIKRDNIVYIFNDMDTKPKTWGHPGKTATDVQKINYSSHMKNLSKEEQESIDLVFIDGRFRVACCLKCFDIMKDECSIVFDDFLNRPQYHIVLNYFDMVEKCSNTRTVLLRKKQNVCVPHELIKKYELIVD
jgi:hypothetical protein